MKRVQLLGHIAEVAKSFLGLERELTVDTDNAELRIHDGVTEGGRRFLDRDANDNRYQQRSVELDGLLGWEPQERGLLARLGPSNYRLRALTVNGLQLTIENANGYDGNPLIGLASTIQTDHLWTGAHSFQQPVQALAGVVGNLTGDTAGTHVGNVEGDVTGNLTGDAAGNHTGTFTGNVDVSAGTITFADGQIPLTALEAAILNFITNAGLPVGSITAYSGFAVDIPANWFICDGTNGTPDLRGRFIVGASVDYPEDSTGGSPNHTHVVTVDAGGAHTHTGTASGHALTIAELPAHSHGNGVIDDNVGSIFAYGTKASPAGGNVNNDSGSNSTQGITETIGGGGAHTHGLAIDNGGAHTHTASAANSSNLPPYYSLVYIMKGS